MVQIVYKYELSSDKNLVLETYTLYAVSQKQATLKDYVTTTDLFLKTYLRIISHLSLSFNLWKHKLIAMGESNVSCV